MRSATTSEAGREHGHEQREHEQLAELDADVEREQRQ